MKWCFLAAAAFLCSCAPSNPPDEVSRYIETPNPKPPAWITSRRFDTANAKVDVADPEDNFADLKPWLVPTVTPERTLETNYQLSPDGSEVTFDYSFDLANRSIRQLAEVDVALAVRRQKTRQLVCRSKSVPFKEFLNFKMPYKGTLEGLTYLGQVLTAKFTIPAYQWTTDVYIQPEVTRAVPVADESNLHDVGNLVAFMMTHRTAEIERAFLKDPSLIQVSSLEGTDAERIAEACGTPRLVKFFFEHTISSHKVTPEDGDFYYGVLSNRPETLDYLLSRGFDPNIGAKQRQTTPLLTATMFHDDASVKWLIRHGADVNAQAMGWTVLEYSVKYFDLDAFKMLLAAGADVHHYNPLGFGLMHLAVDQPQFLPIVLAAGIPVDDRSFGTWFTPLMYAASSCHFAEAHWLLDHGASLKLKDRNGDDLLNVVRKSNTLHTVRFFLTGMGDFDKYEKAQAYVPDAPSS